MSIVDLKRFFWVLSERRGMGVVGNTDGRRRVAGIKRLPSEGRADTDMIHNLAGIPWRLEAG